MKLKKKTLLAVALGAALATVLSTNGLAAPQAGGGAATALSVASPDGRLALGFETDAQGMRWTLARDGKALVLPSRLGVAFAVGSPLEKGAERLAEMKVLNVRRASSDMTWSTRLSRRETVRDRYNEMSVELEEAEARAVRVGLGQTSVEKSPRRLTLVFRAYDEGVAFRYVFPEQAAFDGFALTDELTEWRFAPDAQAWTTTYATARDPQEEPFAKGPLAAVDPKRFVGMPVLVETQGATLALCEAALFNWAGLYFRADGAATLRAALAKLPPTPAADPAVAVIATTPAKSPWRVALVGDDEVDLLRKNDLIASLNPPPDPAIDFSFVKPGASTWDWWTESNNALSTALTLKLVDFAAEMGWPYHTVDGGWYGFARRPNHGPNVPLQPRKGFDLARIVSHAKAKGVGVWLWIHWMEIESVGVEETFRRLADWGVVGVKTDFLNGQDQETVNWCERVCRAIRREVEGRDVYFVANFRDEAFAGDVSFAAAGAPERWDARDASIAPLPVVAGAAEPGRVKVKLSLPAHGSCFVVFDPNAKPSLTAEAGPVPNEAVVADLSADWTVVSFTGKNAPAAPLKLPRLASWSQSADPKLKYFAGRAVYEKAVTLPKAAKGGLVLDLGTVKDVVNVWANGRALGCLWEAPYRIALPADLATPGATLTLRIEVVNTWPNRLIGDAIARKGGAAEPKSPKGPWPQWVLDGKPDSGTGIFTWSNFMGWAADEPLLPAGLIGPVRLVRPSS